MNKATTLFLTLALVFLGDAYAQQIDFSLVIPPGAFTDPYSPGNQSGARGVTGPYDLDGDGNVEVLVTDYSGGGRVHVIENVGVNLWEHVYSTPWNDSTGTSANSRYAVGADLDDDGNGEIIFLSGRGYSATNPNAAQFRPGLFVYEYTGSDDDYGEFPASIYDFPNDVPDRWSSEMIAVADIDGDGVNEVMFPNNGGTGFNQFDNWYILSVTGDIGSGFEAWVEEVRLSTRATENFDPVDRGGGSAQAIHPADLDGDGQLDLSLHAWNCFSVTNGRVTGADTYEFPGDGAANGWLHATGPGLPCTGDIDHVSLFGGVVVDIDGNGDDEIFYPRFQTGSVAVLNYEDGEDILQVTTDNLILDAIPLLTTLGITAGDMDGDGNIELIGSGPAYTPGSFVAGSAPLWIRIAEFLGGDPEDPANYELVEVEFPESIDPAAFDLVVRDSAGVVTEFYEDGNGGPEFASKMAFLGDPDNDGFREVAMGFQGVDDSTYVYDEVFNSGDSTYTRTVRSSEANTGRAFLRVISSDGLVVSIEDDRVVVPSDYVLSPNYPNPFNPSTSFTFTLPIDKRVSVKVYDMTGRLVKTLVNDEFYTAGTHQATWDGTNASGTPVASGTYLYTLEHGTFRQSRTMLLIK